jgi:hypothetical protein
MLYNNVTIPLVSLSMTSAASFAVLSLSASRTTTLTLTSSTLPLSTTKLYSLASLAVFGMAPYTKILMGKTNGRLLELDAERAKGAEKEGRRRACW